MKLVNIGFGNLVSRDRILAVVHPDSAPVKRVVKESSDRGYLIDASFGKKTKSVIIFDSGHIVLSSLTPDSILKRCDEEEAIEEV
jgi:regulator of extracellular matrix RemA (YlzA/DUF370 family)